MSTIGQFRHRVTVEAPGDPPSVPDGYGGFTENWQPLDPPTWDCAIEPASQRSLEQLGAGAILAQATHIVRGRYHPGLTTQARIVHEGRTLNVIKVTNLEERDIETDLVCAEIVI